jgi:hypothetical protein
LAFLRPWLLRLNLAWAGPESARRCRLQHSSLGCRLDLQPCGRSLALPHPPSFYNYNNITTILFGPSLSFFVPGWAIVSTLSKSDCLLSISCRPRLCCGPSARHLSICFRFHDSPPS